MQDRCSDVIVAAHMFDDVFTFPSLTIVAIIEYVYSCSSSDLRCSFFQANKVGDAAQFFREIELTIDIVEK
jgi:hypothetical protein